MKSLWHRLIATGALAAAVAALATGCASNPQHTHRPDLLDAKVAADRIAAALKRSGPEFQHVTVQAGANSVTLNGFVASPAARSRAEAIANGIANGIAGIQDNLQIRK